jgi:hypothetical protein
LFRWRFLATYMGGPSLVIQKGGHPEDEEDEED